MRRFCTHEHGRAGSNATELLRKYLKSDAGPIVEAASFRLMELGYKDQSMVKALLRILPIHDDAAYALGKMGIAAKSARPKLLRALETPSFRGSRFEGAKALGLICPGDKQVMKVYRQLWKDKSTSKELQRGCAIGALNMGSAAKSLAPDLARLAKKNPRSMAIDALFAIAPSGKQATKLLSDAAQGKGGGYAFRSAVEGWIEQGEVPLTKVKPLIPLIAAEDREVRYAALLAIGALGPDGAPALDAVTSAMVGVQSLKFELAAIRYLEGLGPYGLRGLAPLLCALHWEVDPKVSMAIGSPGSTPFGDEIIKPKEYKWNDLRVAALETIGGLGAPAAQAIPILTELTKDPVQKVCEAATDALGKIKQ
ncbi:MAG: hypothetical protein GY930_05095 [bacterium]|nr:hypothetical protein [bacterium]